MDAAQKLDQLAADTALAAAAAAGATALRTLPDVTAELAEANRQITALVAEVAWFTVRRATAHSVRPGETLTAIARLYSTAATPITVADLKDWNGLTSDAIRVDQLLRLQRPLTAAPEPHPAPQPVPQPNPAAVEFSIDISNLGADKDLTEKQKIDAHKALLQPHLPPARRYLRDVRVFMGARPLSWTNERLQALTELDSVTISVSTQRTAAEWDAFLAATPERFRRFAEQVKGCYKHECEAEWKKAGKSQAWMDDYHLGNQRISEAMARSPWATQTKDCVVKIMLWFSQHIAASGVVDTMDRFYGGQDFGYFGMDCYHYQVWGNDGRYATPTELFGKIIAFCRKIERPCLIPEWGGERAKGDTTGAGRAQAITDGGALLDANADVVKGANWWCAIGSIDKATGQPRQHHLEQDGEDSPELAAYRKLAAH